MSQRVRDGVRGASLGLRMSGGLRVRDKGMRGCLWLSKV